ncbi:MAG: beta-propeller fold lactonase family protein [Nitrosomonadales bacterium]|nr:beta-propeller fold lactonase family protein [Nitrosomonadales bacterium]
MFTIHTPANPPAIGMLCRLHRYTAIAVTTLLVSLLVACGGSSGSGSGTNGATVSATIDAQGGTLNGPDGVSVEVPAGALDQPTVISIKRSSAGAPAVPEAYPAAGYIYELTPHGLTFNNPVTVRAPLPSGVTTPLVFMASAGEDWKLLDAQVVNGFAEWQRNSFSNYLMGTDCFVPVSMYNDPYWCAHSSSYARLTATPPQALVQTSPGDYNQMNGDAGSYRVDQSATLHFKTTFSLPGNCTNASVTLRRAPYQGSSAGMWGAPQVLQTKNPTITTDAHYLKGTATFDFLFDYQTKYAGKNYFSVVINYDCPGVTKSFSTVTGWDYSNYRSRYVGDGMIVEGNVPTPTAFYTVGGAVSGLTGAGLVLQNNGTNFTPVSADGSFTFSNTLGAGAPYNVSVLTQPAGQTCTVSNGSGTANADISNVAVNCVTTYSIGGTVSGLVGSGLVLQNNAADDLAFTTSGPFSFSTQLSAGATYAVTVKTQPSGSNCTVQSGGTGTANANVTNIVVVCTSTGALALVANSGVTNGTNGLSVFRVSPTTGALAFLGNVNAGNTPYAVAISPNGLYAYVTNQIGGTVSSYSIDNVAGTVSLIPLSSPQSLNASGIAMDRLGRYIWVANYGYSTVSAFAIGAGGVLSAAGAPMATLSSYPYVITAHPTMDFVYAAHVMSNAITVYSVNTTSGALSLQQTLSNAITSPRGFTIDPSGRFLYTTSANGGISAFSINATTGQLASIGSVSSGNATNSVAVHPNGLYLYVVNRTSTGNVLVFSIDQITGALTPFGSAYSAGNNPSSVAVNAAGTHLYVTNLTSNDVSAFAISGGGGTLTSLGATVSAGSAPEGIAVTP